MTAEHTVKSKNVTRFSISCPADAGGIRDALADVDPRARLLSFEEDGIANFGEFFLRRWARLELELTHEEES